MKCSVCPEEIPAGTAVIRSASFKQVAYHRECWQSRAEVFVPTQRVAGDVATRVNA